jgi:hypothetical protein
MKLGMVQRACRLELSGPEPQTGNGQAGRTDGSTAACRAEFSSMFLGAKLQRRSKLSGPPEAVVPVHRTHFGM